MLFHIPHQLVQLKQGIKVVEAGQSECVIAMIRPMNRGHGGGGQGKKEVMKRPHKAEVDEWGYCSSKLPLVCDQKGPFG